MIDGRSEMVKDLLENAPFEYLSSQKLCFSLVYTPNQIPPVSWSPSKAEFIYTRANLKVPPSIKSPSDEEHSEIVRISPLCLAVNVGCETMVKAILKHINNIDVDQGIEYLKRQATH